MRRWKRERKRETHVVLHEPALVPIGDLSAYYVINAFALAKFLKRVIRKERIDIVVSANPLPGLLASCVAEKMRVPFVTDYLDHFPDSASLYYQVEPVRSMVRQAVKLVTHLSLHRSTRIVVVSESFRDLVINEYGVAQSKVFYIPNGVDLNRFRPRSRDYSIEHAGGMASCFSSESFNLLYSGTILPRMDLETPLKVVRKLRSEGFNVTFLATGFALDARSNRLIQSYRNASFFRFLGGIREDLLPYIMGLADACIAPYKQIPMNFSITLKMLEYLSCGKLLFAPPIPDLLKHFSGFVSTYRNTYDLEIGLKKAVLMRQTRDPGVVPPGLEEFSWDSIAGQYERLLHKTMERGFIQ
jgi:glycosyltransferase involved in cell wall biosynthesis